MNVCVTLFISSDDISPFFLRCVTSRTSAPGWTCCSCCENFPSVWRTSRRSDSHYKHLICTCHSHSCQTLSSPAFHLRALSLNYSQIGSIKNTPPDIESRERHICCIQCFFYVMLIVCVCIYSFACLYTRRECVLAFALYCS